MPSAFSKSALVALAGLVLSACADRGATAPTEHATARTPGSAAIRFGSEALRSELGNARARASSLRDRVLKGASGQVRQAFDDDVHSLAAQIQRDLAQMDPARLAGDTTQMRAFLARLGGEQRVSAAGARAAMGAAIVGGEGVQRTKRVAGISEDVCINLSNQLYSQTLTYNALVETSDTFLQWSVDADNEGDSFTAWQYLVYSSTALGMAGLVYLDLASTADQMNRWSCVN